MTRLPSLLLVLAVAAALAAALSYGCHERRSRLAAETAWEADRRAVLAEAAASRARADSAVMRADSLAAVLALARVRAAADSARAAQLAARIRATPVSDSCTRYTAPRDSLAEHLQAEASALREALSASESAAERLRAAYVLAAASRDSLAAVLLRRPEPDPGWRVPLLGLRVPPAVETGVRCALPGGVAWATTEEPAIGALVAVACVVAQKL